MTILELKNANCLEIDALICTYFSFQHSQNALTILESLEPGDKVLIPKRKRNIRFEGSGENEKLILRAEILEA